MNNKVEKTGDITRLLGSNEATRFLAEKGLVLDDRYVFPGDPPQLVGPEDDFMRTVSGFHARDEFVATFSWAVPSQGAIKKIASYSPLIEVGAGIGYWAYLIRKAGGDIIATDSKDEFNSKAIFGYERHAEWVEVDKHPHGIAARYPDRTLLLVWPTYDASWAAEALALHRMSGGTRAIYIGEGDGGCTADDEFHRQLDEFYSEIETMHIPQWWGMHDHLYVYGVKGT